MLIKGVGGGGWTEQIPMHLPKAEYTTIKLFQSRRNHNDSAGDVMLALSAKSASTIPKSNWLCLISGSNMPRIITKTNTDPSYGPEPQEAAKNFSVLSTLFGLLAQPSIIFT